MEKALTKTECGELEFQLGYYTGYTAKTIGRNSVGCEIALINEHVNGNSSCAFILDVYFDERGFELLHVFEIRGNMNIELITGITKALKTANEIIKG